MLQVLPARGDGEGKKLREAARLWARGELADEHQDAQDRTHLDAAFEAFGLVVEGEPAHREERWFYLWPENQQAWFTFMDLQSQWRTGMGGPTGLDYAAVLAHLRHGLRLPHPRLQKLYRALRVLEHGALVGFAERAKEREEGHTE